MRFDSKWWNLGAVIVLVAISIVLMPMTLAEKWAAGAFVLLQGIGIGFILWSFFVKVMMGRRHPKPKGPRRIWRQSEPDFGIINGVPSLQKIQRYYECVMVEDLGILCKIEIWNGQHFIVAKTELSDPEDMKAEDNMVKRLLES